MEIHISIGENRRFELREALLVYGDRQRSFVTRHRVVHHKDGPPTLEAAQPLTMAFVESLTHSLYGGTTAEVLPEHVVAKDNRMIVWWTPACRRQMFYQDSELKAAELNGRNFPQPPLVWRVDGVDLKIRALIENTRPTPETKMAVAPFWNISDDGRVCVGTMRRPDTASVKSTSDWERGFYESAFTHANVGRLTRHEGGFEGLWSAGQTQTVSG